MDLWLAHYIAEKIVKVENETDLAIRGELERECFELILRLWERRFNKSGNFNPLMQLEETLEILESFVAKSFEYWRYAAEKTTGDYTLLAESISDSFYRIIDALVVLSILPDKFIKARSWSEALPELLTEEEQKLVLDLNSLLDRGLKKMGISFEDLTNQDDNIAIGNFTDKVFGDIEHSLQQLLAKFGELKMKSNIL